MELCSIRKDCVAPTGLGLILRCVPRAYESVLQPPKVDIHIPFRPTDLLQLHNLRDSPKNTSCGKAGCDTESYALGYNLPPLRGCLSVGAGLSGPGWTQRFRAGLSRPGRSAVQVGLSN